MVNFWLLSPHQPQQMPVRSKQQRPRQQTIINSIIVSLSTNKKKEDYVKKQKELFLSDAITADVDHLKFTCETKCKDVEFDPDASVEQVGGGG